MSRLCKDKKLLFLLNTIIDHQVPGDDPEKGLPIGNLTSQYFANLYLGELDHHLKRLGVKYYIRYMDDFILFSEKKSDLHRWLEEIVHFLDVNLKLKLKEKATRIAPFFEGVPFLGLRIFKNVIRIQRPNLVRLRQRIRQQEKAYVAGRIGEGELIRSVGSMVAHVKYANSTLVRRGIIENSLRLA